MKKKARNKYGKHPLGEEFSKPHEEPLDGLAEQLQNFGQWVARRLTQGPVVCSGCRKTVQATDKQFAKWRYLAGCGKMGRASVRAPDLAPAGA